MASANFRNFVRQIAKGNVDFDTASLKVMLVSSVPSESNLDSWVYRSDVTNEVTGTGYTAGGVSQAYTLDALDTTNNRQPVTLTSNTTAWTSTTVSTVGAIVYVDTGSAATDILLFFVDFGGTQSFTNATFGINYTTPFYLNA